MKRHDLDTRITRHADDYFSWHVIVPSDGGNVMHAGTESTYMRAVAALLTFLAHHLAENSLCT